MKSQQVNFYLTTADQRRLEEELRSAWNFVVIANRVYNRHVRVLQPSEIEAMDQAQAFVQVYLVDPELLSEIQFHHLPLQPYQAIDILRSPIVEFDRCRHTSNKLGRGRFYAVNAYYDGTVIINKDQSFLKWSKGIMRTAKRCLTGHQDSPFYYGDEALQLKKEGEAEFSAI